MRFLIKDKKSTNLELHKWDHRLPYTITNVVPLYGKCVEIHKKVNDPYLHYTPDLLEKKKDKD